MAALYAAVASVNARSASRIKTGATMSLGWRRAAVPREQRHTHFLRATRAI
jgi:hypothetical protein